jgi:glycosyltransferase involved in cell wall biosynthesis
MKKQLLILGYFGYFNNQLDGQTIKTRNIYDLLKLKEEIIEYKILFFDTQILRIKKLNFFIMFYNLFKSKKLLYIPAENNLHYFFPLIYIVCRLKKIDIHYIVVGGWLLEFLKSRPIHRSMLKKIKGIYPETQTLCIDLKNKYGYNNVYQLNNFKIHDYTNTIVKSKDSGVVNLVFLARVNKMKGIDTIFKLAYRLKAENIKNTVMDIYGPIHSEYKFEFESELLKLDNVHYKGVLNQTEIYKTLVNYDLMLFPTKYFTEGFPGSILDAFIAEVPVIASRWKYADEFIEDNVNGILADFNDPDQFIEKCIGLINNPSTMCALKGNLMITKNRFGPDAAWGLLKEKIFS